VTRLSLDEERPFRGCLEPHSKHCAHLSVSIGACLCIFVEKHDRIFWYANGIANEEAVIDCDSCQADSERKTAEIITVARKGCVLPSSGSFSQAAASTAPTTQVMPLKWQPSNIPPYEYSEIEGCTISDPQPEQKPRIGAFVLAPRGAGRRRRRAVGGQNRSHRRAS
jgi:hypothetical protein